MENKKSSNIRCTVCNSPDITDFIQIDQVPVECNKLVSSHQEALNVTKDDIHLTFCHHCGHIFNRTFHIDLLGYSQDYENSLHFSPRFQEYATGLASRLIEKYDLRNKDIIEIGCGKGDFLSMLCELGHNRGIGFDTSYAGHQNDLMRSGNLTFIQDYYTEKYAHYPADLICCRHVLEHIPEPVHFLNSIANILAEHRQTIVFFEVPNVKFMLHDLSIWDIIYEHCSYFCKNSLSKLFDRCGYRFSDLTESFDGQYLTIEAVKMLPPENSFSEFAVEFNQLKSDVDRFAQSYRDTIEKWRANLHQVRINHRKIVLWGAGSKGVTFLNALNIEDQIEYVVDINPRKQGRFVPGTGQEIVAGDFLSEYEPDVIIIMNAIYKDEIQGMLKEGGVEAEVLVV